MKGIFPIDKFQSMRTPFYYYDTKVLRDTLDCLRAEAGRYNNFVVHYAVKANANPKVLTIIRESGLGVDCVSGGEIRAAVQAGFPASKIVFAGVGKADWEINFGVGLRYLLFQCGVCARVRGHKQFGRSQRQGRQCGFPHQSGCRGAYPCQHYDGACRE